MDELSRKELLEKICPTDATFDCNGGNYSSDCDKCENLLNQLLDKYDEKVKADEQKRVLVWDTPRQVHFKCTSIPTEKILLEGETKMISAEEARELTNAAINERFKKELGQIKICIERAAKEGKSALYYEATISPDIILYLKNLGYDVKINTCRNETTRRISWEEKKENE